MTQNTEMSLPIPKLLNLVLIKTFYLYANKDKLVKFKKQFYIFKIHYNVFKKLPLQG